MAHLLTNSPIGLLGRWLSGGRLLPPTEQQPGFQLPPPYRLAATRTQPQQQQEQEQEQEQAKPATRPPWNEPQITAEGAIQVGWYSSTDPDNPQNWSFGAKLLVYLEVNLITFMVYMSVAIFSAAEGEFRTVFGVSRSVTELGMSLYVLGYGTGPMIWSPLSEIPSVGRNPPYVVSVTIFLLLSIPTAVVNNVPGFLILRFLQGFFGSPGLATGGASIADVTGLTHLPYGLYVWAVCSIAGPAVAPVIAGFSVPVKGWHWSMWEVLWAAGGCFVFLLFLPETSGPAILHLRAQRLRALTGNPAFQSQSEIAVRDARPTQIVYDALVIPWKINALDPAILFTTVYIGLVYAIFYSYFEVLPRVYITMHAMTLGQLGLIFLGAIVGTLLVLPGYFAFTHWSLNADFRRGVWPRPEKRLVPALCGSVLVPVGLFLFAWTARPDLHWVVPTVGLVLEVAGMSLVIQCVFSYVAVAYLRYSASLFAINDLARAYLAFAAIMWSDPLYDRLGVARGTTLLAGLTVGCVGGMFTLYWWGPALRKRSRFASD
ncbi:MFS general substrate transporter [Aspergillus japonicus CBS 114.51]|uniref:MFS-type transporter pyvG n=2 Tax=Aspergillus TaxID=5052 RepID=PYVG_ASPV1|nr:MFS general substrate transporter [Aspergillus japonicus CBS 114.51]A0A2V5GRP3.1 RecName: Full=MFS-type transporter pyvG; AltName: Full=Pyranoviolin A biosynthesis cluster protein G [Aspergillus violaceofuscus CBS 115571]PYI13688.1 MFS general substrate transporter [Aspergillus violaceofuscus CBS 115571]RAH84213.1 MFS general substrate transporter [Aspergillus japonicus CBS 114.51]FAA01297.1 TPA: major facilitator superfamily transporter PyvG [Aspergillus violaceofuscus]